MAKAGGSINIKSPVEKIFNYISEPTNQPEIWPSLIEIKDVERLPDGNTKNRWVYKMAGIRFEGTSEGVEYVPNRRIVSKTKGGVVSTQTWTFQPEGDETKVTFEVDYTVPIPLLGKLAETIILKMNEHEGEIILANLKARMEA